MSNLGWLTATPNRRKSEDANQIINAALNALDFLCKISLGCAFISQAVAGKLLRPARRWRKSRRVSPSCEPAREMGAETLFMIALHSRRSALQIAAIRTS